MTQRVHISAAVRAALIGEASLAAPHECCGVLGGRDDRIVAVFPVENVAADAASRFDLEPVGLVGARAAARHEGLDVAGFYHSHPRTSPEPSSYDVANAWYPECVYVVIGLEPGPAIRAFRIAEGRAAELELDGDPT